MRELTKNAQIKKMQPSFRSAHTFFTIVDSLPTGPRWDCQMVEITGDINDATGKPLNEQVELWLRNPLECVAELIGNPAFDGYVSYEPERVYTNSTGRSRVYDEMWTGDWWWDIQVRSFASIRIRAHVTARERLIPVELSVRLSSPQTKLC